jgi:hypothetical protein
MPFRVDMQPNGLFVIFSTVVDQFTWGGLDAESVIAVLEEHYDCGPKTAFRKLQNAREDFLQDGKIGTGVSRWKHDLAIIRTVHGDDAVAIILHDLGLVKEHLVAQNSY